VHGGTIADMQTIVMCIKIAAALAVLTIVGGAASVLLRGLLARWMPGMRRSPGRKAARPSKAGRARRLRHEIGLGVALIPVAGAYLITVQAIHGSLLGATTTPGTVGLIAAMLVAVVAFTAVAPQRAGYMAAIAATGLGLYLLLYVPAVLPADVSKMQPASWTSYIPFYVTYPYAVTIVHPLTGHPGSLAVINGLATPKTTPISWVAPGLGPVLRDAAKGTASYAGQASSLAVVKGSAIYPQGTGFSWTPLQELLVLSLACLAGGISLTGRTIVADARAYRSKMNARVEQLTQTRFAVIDAAAAEFRRLERDLHDGAQARLVALGINLRTAEKLIKSSPDDAASLVADCREASAKALTELRDLVRGIYPPVLADRGLPDAIRSLALDYPARVVTDISLDGRPPAPVESAVYFAVAEALNNAAKHAQAGTILIIVSHDGDGRREGILRVEVHDDGIGGADPANGSGLAGMERRLGAFDGILAVSSPVGGPTIVVIEVPCELSSPKTSIS
jgi:signal transduction histidine kinase